MTPENIIWLLSSHDIHILRESIFQLSGWKDNITYKGKLISWENIILQFMRSIRWVRHAEFIEKVVDFISRECPELWFAHTPSGMKRFYRCEWGYIQLMECTLGSPAREEDVTEDFMISVAEKLAIFHKTIAGFSWEEYGDINYHRDRIDDFAREAELFAKKKWDTEIFSLLEEYRKRREKITINRDLKKWVIHGDPVFKNFLIDSSGSITAWIDYDMMSVTTQLWDLADMYRGYLKLSSFSWSQARSLLDAYISISPLSSQEQDSLPDYIRLMALDTGYRYILALDPSSGFYNAIGDSWEKARRCLRDHDRVENLF